MLPGVRDTSWKPPLPRVVLTGVSGITRDVMFSWLSLVLSVPTVVMKAVLAVFFLALIGGNALPFI